MDDDFKKMVLDLVNDLERQAVDLCDEAKKLSDFTLYEDENKRVHEVHYWNYMGENIPFKILSDESLRGHDIKMLKNREQRERMETLRSLRIASSLSLLGALYLVVISDHVKSLVRFKKDNEDYIIDYARNLIMLDKDYKKMFPYKVIEELDQCDLAYLADIIPEPYDGVYLTYILLNFSAIKEELKKKDKSFMPRFDDGGINGRNKFILSRDNESLFWQGEDFNSTYINDANNIMNFTLNPLRFRLDVLKRDERYYQYKDYLFRFYSDMIKDDNLKKELLSNERYGKCFNMSIKCAFALSCAFPPESLRLVLAFVAVTEQESFYHAWVEYKGIKSGNWYAVDYTGNIVMESDDYLRLRKAKVLNILPYEKLDAIYGYFEVLQPKLDKYLVLYFGEELLADLEKNKSLFKGMQ